MAATTCASTDASLLRSARSLLQSAKAFEAAVMAERQRTNTAALFHVENEASQAVVAYTCAVRGLAQMASDEFTNRLTGRAPAGQA